MSVRQGLLALLAEQPMYGYQLRQEFERRTGATWPLNIGQVYTTISRLQRDGLVDEEGRQGDGSVVYAITAAGRDEVGRWWRTPVERGAPARDELAIKLAIAVTTPGVDVTAVVQRQRSESLRALQEYTRLKARAMDGGVAPGQGDGAGGPEGPADAVEDISWLLVLDALVFAAEAEVRWLDHVEQRLAVAAARRGRTAGGPVDGRVHTPVDTRADTRADGPFDAPRDVPLDARRARS